MGCCAVPFDEDEGRVYCGEKKWKENSHSSLAARESCNVDESENTSQNYSRKIMASRLTVDYRESAS